MKSNETGRFRLATLLVGAAVCVFVLSAFLDNSPLQADRPEQPAGEGEDVDGNPDGAADEGADDVGEGSENGREDPACPEPATRGEGDLSVSFSLQDAIVAPGGEIQIPLDVDTNASLSMVSWSVEFDPTVFELLGVSVDEKTLEKLKRPPPQEADFSWFGSQEEGWIQATLVMDFDGCESRSLPPGLIRKLAAIDLLVSTDAEEGTYPVSFTRPDTAGFESHFRNETGPVFNSVRQPGRPFTKKDMFGDISTPELDDGVISVSIIGDVGIFLSGDANLDLKLDIADAVTVLEYLFLGGSMICPAAGDVNSDEKLDISDPVSILGYLFLGYDNWAPETETVDGGGASSGCSLERKSGPGAE